MAVATPPAHPKPSACLGVSCLGWAAGLLQLGRCKIVCPLWFSPPCSSSSVCPFSSPTVTPSDSQLPETLSEQEGTPRFLWQSLTTTGGPSCNCLEMASVRLLVTPGGHYDFMHGLIPTPRGGTYLVLPKVRLWSGRCPTMEGQGADGLRTTLLGNVPVGHFPCQRERLLLRHGKCCWPYHACRVLQAWPHPGDPLPESLTGVPACRHWGAQTRAQPSQHSLPSAEQRRGLTSLNLLAMLECLGKH